MMGIPHEPKVVGRDGNVVPDAPLPTLFGDAKQRTEATTDVEDARAKQRVAAIDAGEKDVGETADRRRACPRSPKNSVLHSVQGSHSTPFHGN